MCQNKLWLWTAKSHFLFIYQGKKWQTPSNRRKLSKLLNYIGNDQILSLMTIVLFRFVMRKRSCHEMPGYNVLQRGVNMFCWILWKAWYTFQSNAIVVYWLLVSGGFLHSSLSTLISCGAISGVQGRIYGGRGGDSLPSVETCLYLHREWPKIDVAFFSPVCWCKTAGNLIMGKMTFHQWLI